jgi:rubredoxin
VQDEIHRVAQGQDRFECDVCRYVAKGKPAKCPVCGSGPTHFHAVDAEIATTSGDETMNLSEVYDGRELHWTEDATALLDSLEEWQEKRRVRARVEKSALKKATRPSPASTSSSSTARRPAARPPRSSPAAAR